MNVGNELKNELWHLTSYKFGLKNQIDLFNLVKLWKGQTTDAAAAAAAAATVTHYTQLVNLNYWM